MSDVMRDLLGEFDRPLRNRQPCLWINERRDAIANCGDLPYGLPDIEAAEQRWLRFAPLLEVLFPDLANWRGIIESALIPVPHFAERLRFSHPLLVKADHALPIAGSVKARGGIYAVLCIAEQIALQEGLLAREDADHRVLGSARAQAAFKRYELSVGSTGNLGLSIGIMGRALGFRTTVHMSSDAKPWKKERLRSVGAIVVEHAHDYAAACAAGRDAAAADPMIHFIDDENSPELFLGYSVAALRLREQLRDAGIAVDRKNPLFLYLPCGVGGAPGGITFGARCVFGDDVHCFFAEPVEAPCMFMGLKTRMHEALSVYDIGLGLKTQADGLAVPRPSRLVCGMMDRLVSGCYTVTDAQMHAALRDLFESESMEIEPSAAAACAGPTLLLGSEAGQAYLQKNVHGLGGAGTHILWTTGGAMIPAEQHAAFRAFR
jgi:D-serine dehydratase